MLSASLFTFCAFLPLVHSVIVPTIYGQIKGQTNPHPGSPTPFKSVSRFLGVPFAAPPIGELRFKAPQPPKEWKPNVREAKRHGNICWQSDSFEEFIKVFTLSFKYSEDCLYLDVYTPNVSLSLPVMVYIHGGGYEGGTSIIFPSDVLALHGVVVVVIQYRLGPFGFLTTGDSAAPGNFGMLDQVEALKWVRDNIENFGGNPNMVTIFGVSAGGSSVGLHLLSPLSKELFHQAIAESGVDVSPFAIQPTSIGISVAKELAQKLSCPTGQHSEMVACLREKKDTDIQTASQTSSLKFVDYLQWAPVVDKTFLYDTPRNLRKKGDFKQVPLIIGFTSNEGSFTLPLMAKDTFGMTENVDNGVSPNFFMTFLMKFAHARNSRKETADIIADALEFMYTPWPNNSDKYALRSQLVDLIGDYIFFAPSHEVADIHSKVSPVYIYEFAHRPKNASRFPEWMGVAHGDNVVFDFGIPLLPGLPFVEADKNVSMFIMEMYAKFAWSAGLEASGVTWKKYNSSERAYLRVGPNPKMAASFNPRRMAFWNDYHPKLTQLKLETAVGSGASGIVTMGTFLLIVFIIITVAIFWLDLR